MLVDPCTGLLVYSDRTKVTYVFPLFSGKALAWTSPIWEQNVSIMFSLFPFLAAFQTIEQYAIKLCTLAPGLSWNDDIRMNVRTGNFLSRSTWMN